MVHDLYVLMITAGVVSLLFKAPDKDDVDSIFSCYQRKVIVAAKDSIETEE